MTIAPLSDPAEVSNVKAYCEDTKHEIQDPSHNRSQRSHPITGIKGKLKIPVCISAEGDGFLKKRGKADVPCYYFVGEYQPKHDNYRNNKRQRV